MGSIKSEIETDEYVVDQSVSNEDNYKVGV